MMAGHETTANLVGNGLNALFAHPEQMARFRDDPDIDRTAIEELLRHDGPVQMAERIALEDTTVGGVDIPKGRVLIPIIAAANRDPDVFTDPDALDLGRDPNPHIAFGGGAHFCIGAALARVEARIMLGHLVRRFPGIKPAGKAMWRPSFTIRGLKELPVAW